MLVLAALTPALLGDLARRLVTGGEWLAAIEVDPAGAVALREAVTWDVQRRAGAQRLALHRHIGGAILLHYRSHAGRGSRACALCDPAG